jgi:hemerythrin-like metal-binding protein
MVGAFALDRAGGASRGRRLSAAPAARRALPSAPRAGSAPRPATPRPAAVGEGGEQEVLWTAALAVGHDKIDSDHQELFRRLARLLAAMRQGDRSEIGRLFDFLGSYVVEHFGMEQKLMEAANYPAYPMHKAAHERFVRDYLELKKTFEATGGGAALTLKVRDWTSQWLTAHIAQTDKQLAAYLSLHSG